MSMFNYRHLESLKRRVGSDPYQDPSERSSLTDAFGAPSDRAIRYRGVIPSAGNNPMSVPRRAAPDRPERMAIDPRAHPMGVGSPLMAPQPQPQPVQQESPAPQAAPADDYGKRRSLLSSRLMELRTRMNGTMPGSSERVALANEIRGINQTIKALDYSRTPVQQPMDAAESAKRARALFEQGRAMYEGDVQPSPESRRAERDRFAQMYFYKIKRPDLAVRPNRAELLELSGVSIPVSSGLADTMGRLERRQANARSLADIDSGEYEKRYNSDEAKAGRARATARQLMDRDAARQLADRGYKDAESNIAGESAASELRAARTAAATAQERAKAKIAESEALTSEIEAEGMKALAGVRAGRMIDEVKMAKAGGSFARPVGSLIEAIKWANDNPNSIDSADGKKMLSVFNEAVAQWNKLPDDLKGAAAVKILDRLRSAGVNFSVPAPDVFGSLRINPMIERGSVEWEQMREQGLIGQIVSAALPLFTPYAGVRTARAYEYNRRHVGTINTFLSYLREAANSSSYVSPNEQ